MAAAGGTGYTATAVVFDGANDYLSRGADLTSNADAKTFLFSGWFYFTDLATADRRIYQNTGNAGHIRVDLTTSKLLINMENSAGAQILEATVDTPLMATGAWTHIMIAIDLANSANRSVYVDGSAATVTWTTYSNDTIDFTAADHAVGATVAGGGKLAAYVSEYYLAFGQYLDLSSSANRAKFRSATGKPVSLGATGSLPTGVQPSIYLSGTASTFATNKGAGGGFTVTGTLTDAPSAP